MAWFNALLCIASIFSGAMAAASGVLWMIYTRGDFIPVILGIYLMYNTTLYKKTKQNKTNSPLITLTHFLRTQSDRVLYRGGRDHKRSQVTVHDGVLRDMVWEGHSSGACRVHAHHPLC